MWAQAEGAKAKKRQHVYLHVPTLVVAPIQFERTSRSVGEVGLGGAKTNLACWSATRENPNLTLAAQDDPLFQWRLTKLTPDECKELEKTLNTSRSTRVRIDSARGAGSFIRR